MSVPATTVTAYFDVPSSTTFIIGDPVRGIIGSDYVLGGDVAVDIASLVRMVTIRRGRTRELNEITAGSAVIEANNHFRQLDPENTAGTYYGNIRPGKRVRIDTDGVTIFDGKTADYDYSYSPSLESLTDIEVVDVLAELAASELDDWTTTAGQTAGQRLEDLFDRPEVGIGAARNLDAGSSTLAADVVTAGANALNYAQTVTQSDLGVLFASRQNLLTFFGRSHPLSGSGAVEFSDDGTGVAFQGIEADYDVTLLHNRVSVTRDGGTTQTVQDDASIALYGEGKPRTLSVTGLLADSDDQALSMANYLLNLYKDPQYRVSSVTVILNTATDADRQAILALDIGDVVTVTFTPNQVGDPFSKFCRVEGFAHVIDKPFHTVTVYVSNLGDTFSGAPFIIGDPVYGVIGGPGVLTF